MSIELKNSPNYAAQIVRVHTLVTLPGLDNLLGFPIGGYQALVSKDIQVGDLMVVFPAESQLSDAFVSAHNLYRHAEKNIDPTQAGYLEDTRRVKAIKMRGHNSNALAMHASVIGSRVVIAEGDLFDTVDGVELCRKYELKIKIPTGAKSQQEKIWKQIEMPLHIETENYWRNKHLIEPWEHITVSQKLHGSSVRYGHILVPRDLSIWERILKRLGVRIVETEYAFVVGSRKVIKSVVRD